MDAVILASPIYRASYTRALKNLLDWLPLEAMRDKPVGIVAMGTSQYHYLAVDVPLRGALAWFGALVAPTSVYLAAADFEDGALSANAANATHGKWRELAFRARATKAPASCSACSSSWFFT